MAIEDVKEYFKQFNRENDVIEFDVSTATVPLAAKAVGVKEGQIAKTLAVNIENGAILVVIAGDCKLNHSKFKKEFGCPIKMVKFNDVKKVTGHPVGGVCPFGNNNGLKIYLDISLKSYDYIFPGCGSENSAIKLTNDELNMYSNNMKWVDVSVPS
ncbi:YbaK/EbsC family protein [Clostridiaceae bacterium HSG29]|nr:YbaK/EbsC family protein [Clostridiaceae bacterium HSG29]